MIFVVLRSRRFRARTGFHGRARMSLSAVVILGASRLISRDTVGWEQPNSSATRAWDRLWRR